jgi:magnesium chelatase family protein
LFVAVPPVPAADLTARDPPGATVKAKEAVAACRELERTRFPAAAARRVSLVNAQLKGKSLHAACRLEPKTRQLLESAVERFGLSMRAHARTLRVARTIADLDGKPQIGAEHVAEALSFRLVSDAASAKSLRA